MAVITISRQFGAGGKTLGECLAERLQYTLVDEVLIEYVAQKANLSHDWLRYLEKDAGGSLRRFLSGFKPIRKSYLFKTIIDKQGFIDGHHYVELLDKIITQIASEDNVIIIGRGGQYILQSHPNTIHLLLVANSADRILFLRRKYNVDQQQAEKILIKQDKIRNNLFRYFCKENYDDPLLYDHILNMSRVSMHEAVTIVQMMLQERSWNTA